MQVTGQTSELITRFALPLLEEIPQEVVEAMMQWRTKNLSKHLRIEIDSYGRLEVAVSDHQLGEVETLVDIHGVAHITSIRPGLL